MKRLLESIVFPTLVSLVWPGAGHLFLGKTTTGTIFALAPFLISIVMSWSRLVAIPVGISALVLVITINYLLSIGHLIVLLAKPNLKNFKKNYAITICLVLVALMSCTFLLTKKEDLLGFQIYIIPSQSMAPTLKPGDFILVDTWVYRNSMPQLRDVVIFNRPGRSEFYVKRVSTWDNGEVVNNNQFFLLGDNRQGSTDSRYFGGIDKEGISGKVNGVLFSLDNDMRFRPERTLMQISIR